MNNVETIAAILRSDDNLVNVAVTPDGTNSSQGPLIIDFGSDEMEREFSLFIDVLAPESKEDLSFLVFSLVFPFYIPSEENFPELLRSIFILNSHLPIGAHSFDENTGSLLFKYKLPMESLLDAKPILIKEVVNMIRYFTREHGVIFDKVIDGELNADQVIASFDAKGETLENIFGAAFS